MLLKVKYNKTPIKYATENLCDSYVRLLYYLLFVSIVFLHTSTAFLHDLTVN